MSDDNDKEMGIGSAVGGVVAGGGAASILPRTFSDRILGEKAQKKLQDKLAEAQKGLAAEGVTEEAAKAFQETIRNTEKALAETVEAASRYKDAGKIFGKSKEAFLHSGWKGKLGIAAATAGLATVGAKLFQRPKNAGFADRITDEKQAAQDQSPSR